MSIFLLELLVTYYLEKETDTKGMLSCSI